MSQENHSVRLPEGKKLGRMIILVAVLALGFALYHFTGEASKEQLRFVTAAGGSVIIFMVLDQIFS